MSDPQDRPSGRFVWYELMTTDAAAAEAFYRAVIGWEASPAGQPDKPYTLFRVPGAPGEGEAGAEAAGLLTLPEEARARGARPGWVGYVAVDDVDGCAARVTAAGGQIRHPPTDIPGVGRFAVAADPQGAVFVLFATTREPPPPRAPGAPGHVSWRELVTSDREAGFAFYAGLFGWTKDRAIPMGLFGSYQLFAAEGEVLGGMMTRPPMVPASFWIYYIQVDGLAEAVARLRAAGGMVVNGPHQVPGGTWVVQALDPQGALFALVSARA
ncbi:VOC family protein [Roseomonas sp. NAR14]|uniref:VOC family protein n=1 Tax=Roseomonas acroporae TaxID=2937791 RepID=A0A9X1Y938_9PROT|nr:VOC family protein [Roseomonas acroporae]MCK8786394.1 VOC family protein [Roseomonas acroporae]